MAEKVKVLIGDNSCEFGLMCASALKKEGFFAVTRRNSGEELLIAMEKDMPDLLAVRAQTEDMSAPELLLEARRELGRLPLVLVFSESCPSYLERQALDAGADSFLSGPLDPEKLKNKLVALYRFRSGTLGDRSGQEWINLEYTVTNAIHSLRIPANIKGYYYIRTGLILAVSDREMLESITKLLYPAIAAQHNTTAQRVERAIRHAIEVTWENGDRRALGALFGDERKRPTNSEFIALLTDNLRIKYAFDRRMQRRYDI